MERRKRGTVVLLSSQKSGGAASICDADWMDRLAQGDSGAFETLYDRYASLVYSISLRISRQPTSAEEIVQDVFLLLWRNAARYQASRGPLGPWLATVARNRALDYLRRSPERQRRHEESGNLDLPGSVAAPHLELLIDDARRAQLVRACLRELPEPQRRAIELAYFEGMTHTEIAAALSEPIGTVKTRIRSGLIRMRESLGNTHLRGKEREAPAGNPCPLDADLSSQST